jgi:predicted flavoprotein YhiN
LAAPVGYDVIVIGAGAAGLMAALTAGQRGRRVLVLDHAAEPGRKILISGGGRCNFTNIHTAPERFFSGNRHFAKSALARYTAADFIALVAKHRIATHEKTLGQLFCDGSARGIVAMLLAECAAGGVDLRVGHRVTGLGRPSGFVVDTDHGGFTAPSLILATGGLSIPKLGATGFSHDAAARFGLPLTAIRPALVPLTAADADLPLMRPLSGVALPVAASTGRAILQISSAWREGDAITLDLLPGRDAAAFLRAQKAARPKALLRTVLGGLLPQRLADALAGGWPQGPLAGLTDRALGQVAAGLHGWTLYPAGTEGYAKAEVTLGGVDTAALSSQTMAAKAVPGLFVVGEAVDVTGWLGGYNFQWAWSSGWCAGMAA